MFDTILIANRGEIACRIINTARSMGMRTIAVYSEADVQARHVKMADRAVCIGGPAPADSYLQGARIIQVALDEGAQAIHPGYGFLSENPDFVEAVEAAGLRFVGPSAEAIRAMGLKDAAKTLMAEAGVPVVPGYQNENQEPDHLAQEAAKIGYPVLIKAVAGGGGKGMRLVESADEFDAALASAQAEAKGAFGNDRVLIEKFITSPRHIEIQVFGDGTHAVHLYERDCSLQRRHQKVIEEAPAPGMTPEMRAAMGAAAVRAAEAIGYAGAGTVEFIVDGSDGLDPEKFWFMEMNTRLQVEHPVTEMVTGVDLVEWQFHVAAGNSLPMSQEQIPLKGHAIEARLYAEDVPAGFLPATGRLTHLSFPDGVRADSGVGSGDTISPFYDPMISKVIVHGPTRDIALKKMARGLAETEVAGTVTNLTFLGALIDHAGFAAGEVDTGLIGRDLEGLTKETPTVPTVLAQAAWAAAGLMAEPDWDQGFSLWKPEWRHIQLSEAGTISELRLKVVGRGLGIVEVGEQEIEVSYLRGRWHFDGSSAANWVQDGLEVTVFAQNGRKFQVVDPLERGDDAAQSGNVIVAPMPGLIKLVDAEPGQAVSKGDRLAVLEAMKMEHALVAPRDGVIAEVMAGLQDQVEAGDALIRLEEEPEV